MTARKRRLNPLLIALVVLLSGATAGALFGERSIPEEETIRVSSITWSREQMGRQAVKRLLSRMQGDTDAPMTIVVPCELVGLNTYARAEQPEGGTI